MNQHDLTETYGPVIHLTSKRVVRAKEENGKLALTIHRISTTVKEGGRKETVEIIPRGYVLGANRLVHE